MENVIVSVCDNWPPPPCSQLHGSLQCCSLLNYYQRFWGDTCSHIPHTISLMAFFLSCHTHKHAHDHIHMHVHRRSAYISSDMDLTVVMKKPRMVCCVSVSGAGRCFHVDVHAWWELHSNTGTDLHMATHECTHEQGCTETQMLLRSLCKQDRPMFCCLFFPLTINHELQTRWL